MELKGFQKKFQAKLNRVIAVRRKRSRDIARDPFVYGLISYAAELATRGGKRIRPYLAHLMYRASGGRRPTEALRLSASLELFHAFALIHDDVMDRGTTRHGFRTAHRETSRRLKALRRLGDLPHAGESQAVLTGDLLFAWSQELWDGAVFPAKRLGAARAVYRRMINEVIIGQMLDVDLATRPRATMAGVEQKMRLKTAGYTFIRPLQIGAALAGARASTMKFCEAFGLALGTAFQIQDDLLDVESSARRTGKTAMSDVAERQQTVLTQYVFDRGTPAERRSLSRFLGKRLSARDRRRVRKIFEESGAVAYAQRRIASLFRQAEHALHHAPIQKSAKREFAELLAFIRNRSS